PVDIREICDPKYPRHSRPRHKRKRCIRVDRFSARNRCLAFHAGANRMYRHYTQKERLLEDFALFGIVSGPRIPRAYGLVLYGSLKATTASPTGLGGKFALSGRFPPKP